MASNGRTELLGELLKYIVDVDIEVIFMAFLLYNCQRCVDGILVSCGADNNFGNSSISRIPKDKQLSITPAFLDTLRYILINELSNWL